MVVTTEFDPLRDEGEAYAKRLAAAGVSVQSMRYAGAIHGFLAMASVLDDGKRGIQYVARWLQTVWT